MCVDQCAEEGDGAAPAGAGVGDREPPADAEPSVGPAADGAGVGVMGEAAEAGPKVGPGACGPGAAGRRVPAVPAPDVVPGICGIGDCPLAGDSSGPEPSAGEVGIGDAPEDWAGIGISFVIVPSAILISVGDDALLGELGGGCSTALVGGVCD